MVKNVVLKDVVLKDEVLVITTGGTIDKVYFDAKSDYEIGDSVIDELLTKAQVRCPYQILNLMRKDSLTFTDIDRKQVVDTVAGCEHGQIVITHGTDTMTQTASSLAAIAGKTIVLTGALAPARFTESDATFNIGMAFGAAQILPPGVYIAMNGQIFDAHKVTKNRQSNQFTALSGS
ncbi:MAG: asparaginase [Pseudomonadales bacterium]|nr:asparaginase [Pseudomonadales bacterium]